MATKHPLKPINPLHLAIIQQDEDTCIALAKQGLHDELDAAISGMLAFTKSVMNNESRMFKDKAGYLTKGIENYKNV